MSSTDPAPWEWLVGGRYIDFTLTFTRGLTPNELLERYGADLAAARPVPFVDIHAALQPDIDHAVLRVGTLGEWVFGIEAIGDQGFVPAVLARLSSETETVSIRCGGDAFAFFQYWVNGRPLEQFEPGMSYTLRAAGSHPFWDAAERYQAAQPGTTGIFAALRAAEDYIGACLTQETDDGPLRSVLLAQVRPAVPSSVSSPPLVDPPANPGGLGRRLSTLRPTGEVFRDQATRQE